jgi:large subunit ribosomal protein L5
MKSYAKHITEVVLPKIQKELHLKNLMAVPKLDKIIVDVGIGTRVKVSKDYSDIVDNVIAITGQKPVIIMAKKAISNFKLRQGSPSGVVVTLRKKKMLDFFNRLVNVAFPRIRDFQGLSDKSFDGRGNYSIGIKDCTIFPEINPDDLSNIHGMSITIVTTSQNDEGARALFRALNFPFKKSAAKKDDKNNESKTDEPVSV